MNNFTREDFMVLIRNYIKQDPEAAAYVSDNVQQGLREALQESRERATDMEIVAATLAERRYKGSDGLVLSKLKKWEGKSSLEWKHLISKLEDNQ